MRLPFLATITAAFLVISGGLHAYEIEEQRIYPATPERAVFKIISTADLAAFDPIIRAFQATQPGLTIEYTVAGTTDLMQAIAEEDAAFDLAISSAMDLQTKLANDGFALSYVASTGLPSWAVWRNQVFAFTQEPAVLVASDAFFEGREIPRTRDALIEVLRANPEQFQGRVGTYDVRTSGFGYLMATQDSRNSEAFWRLMEVMGRLDAKLYCCSGDMIRDVVSGELGLAYNVLGSYASAELARTGGFQIIELEDYVNVMLRTSLIPATAQNTQAAHAMINFLSRLEQRPDLVDASGLPPIDNDALQANSSLRPIRFGPGLLVFMDQLKRKNFLRNWENSIFQDK